MNPINRKCVRAAGWLALAAVSWMAGQSQPWLQAQSGPAKSPAPVPADYEKNVVAYVNGAPITRQELGEALIARKGKEQLPLLINRKIIEQAAQKAGITVSDEEVDKDLRELMKTAGPGINTPSEFEKHVLKRRGTTLFEYKEDVLRPGIAMRKFAAKSIQVAEEDLRKAFEANYGEKVECRIILIDKNLNVAKQIYAQVKDSPEAFIRQAKTQEDAHLATLGGKIRPVNHYSAMENIEKAAFRLKDGEISEVLEVAQGYAILLREKLLPPDTTKNYEDVRQKLYDDVLEKKSQLAVRERFDKLKEKAEVRDFLNGRFDVDREYLDLQKKAAAQRE